MEVARNDCHGLEPGGAPFPGCIRRAPERRRVPLLRKIWALHRTPGIGTRADLTVAMLRRR